MRRKGPGIGVLAAAVVVALVLMMKKYGGPRGMQDTFMRMWAGMPDEPIANMRAVVARIRELLEARSTPDIRQEKVAALRQSIAEGTYDVSSRALAQRLIDAGVVQRHTADEHTTLPEGLVTPATARDDADDQRHRSVGPLLIRLTGS